MVEYDSEIAYLESKTDARSKIAAIDAIVNQLLLTAAKAALSEDVTEYSLDDGQTKIKTIRRPVSAIMKSIADLNTLKNEYINQLNGRITQLRDSKNFIGPPFRR